MRERLREQTFLFRRHLAEIGARPEFKIPTDEVIKQTIEPASEYSIAIPEKNYPKVLGSLTELQQMTERVTGNKQSPEELTIQYIESNFLRAFEMNALLCMKQGLINGFILNMDLNYGARMVNNSIGAAIKYNKGTVGGSILRKIDETGVSREEFYDSILRRTANFAAVFNEDGTGFSLVDEMTKLLRGEDSKIVGDISLTTIEQPEFVVAGAEYARNAYKTIHPLAVGVVNEG